MSILIDYIEKKRKAAGIKTHAELARRAWPEMDPNKAGSYWKRLRNASGYEKPQRLQYEDLRALCQALGLDVARVQIELEQIERENTATTP